MPTTRQTSGELSVRGTLPVRNPGWHPWAGATPAPLLVRLDHPDDHYTHIVSLGAASVRLEAVSQEYSWDPKELQWEEADGYSPAIPGYPEAFGDPPDPTKPYKAIARGFKVTRTIGSITEVEWTGLNWSYWIIGSSGMELANTGGSSFDLDYRIEWEPIPLAQSVREVTTPARAHATCVQQLRDTYSWQGDVPVTVTCAGTTEATVSYDSIMLPRAGFTMSWGEGGKWDHTVMIMPPLQFYQVYERYSESWTLAYALSDQYGSGLRASGTEPKDGHETHATYRFGSGYLMGTVDGQLGKDEHYKGGPWTESEFVQTSTSVGIDLVACDQMTPMTTSAGLKAHATHFIDQTVEWDEGQQKYVQSETYNTPLDLVVPGSYAMSFQKTSRYDDRNVPNSDNDTITVTLTDDSLEELHLPTADNMMVLHDRALDAIGIDTEDWGEHDEHGGSYHGLICLWAQSPLSVQWPQDTRADGAPPSWWYNSYSHIPLPRQNVTELVLEDPSVGFIARRDLAWHPTRRNAAWLGPVRPGTREEDLWMHIGNWDRVSATKHLLKGTIIGGPFEMTEKNVVCDENDPVHHTAYGVMPWSEDVTDWRLYELLRFDVTSSYAVPWTLSVKLVYEYDDVTDNYVMNSEERREGFYVDTNGGTVTYVATVPANAVHELIDIDLMRVGAPRLERVRSIEISGMPDSSGTTIVHDVLLLAPQSGVWIESTDVRPMRYGGEPRYTCGTSEFLGVARTPEEYGGWWAVGGHDLARGVRNPGRTVSVAPDWGMPFVTRRISSCGALQDELMDFSAWYGQRIGDWGLEGLYGQIHNTIEGYMSGSAMDAWIDENEIALGLAGGTGWITHVPHLMHYTVASQDILSGGRNQDGATDLPVIVRAGCLRPCGGLNWAHSGAGTAPTFGGKIILYGARIAVATSGTAPVGRAGNGLTYTLYEHPSTGADRLVTTAVTDADSRLRFARGVNEFRHVEYGADAMSDPDWLNRYDYTSDVLAPGETTDDLVFGLHHYQVIPSFASHIEDLLTELDHEWLWVHPENHLFLGVDDGDEGVTISLVTHPILGAVQEITLAEIPDVRWPGLYQDGVGRVLASYGDGAITKIGVLEFSRIGTIPPTPVTSTLSDVVTLISGYTAYRARYEPDFNLWHFLGFASGKMWYVRGVASGSALDVDWEDPVDLGAATENRGDITRLGDGALVVAFDNDGTPVRKISQNGTDWETWY